jgi:hypothetical protein
VDITGNWTVEAKAPGFGMRIAEPKVTSSRTPVIDTGQSEDDYSEPVLLLGRLKAGTARESQRVVHTFLLVRDLLHSAVVTARCGAQLIAGDMQWLPGLAGMPCERCVSIR